MKDMGTDSPEEQIELLKAQHEHDAWRRRNYRWWKIFGVLLLYIIPIHLLVLILWKSL